MSAPRCSIHNIGFDEDIFECPTCGGEGILEDDLEGPCRCYNCLGDGEVKMKWCELCEEEAHEEA